MGATGNYEDVGRFKAGKYEIYGRKGVLNDEVVVVKSCFSQDIKKTMEGLMKPRIESLRMEDLVMAFEMPATQFNTTYGSSSMRLQKLGLIWSLNLTC
ncbi:uncharacterized protein LOC129318271 isoform X2 [Prosopis cineraria]|uniref:uncharacterized protein LOC129318271 isoform X2 n=1 Tax=Prosopis cineraria TaxID=364024 RepID=UPI00241095E2|nr:uncharacterized protein LOC129318271 isoform X2 [Prosopis cineraria]